MAVPDVDPPVLSGNESTAEHQPADDCGRERVEPRGLPTDGPCFSRQDIFRRLPQRTSEIDEDVQTEQQEPDD
jgi:hypothetical protein